MDGRQKVATLLLTLEPEVAAELLSRFGEAERAGLVEALLGTDYIDHDTVQSVLGEFEQLAGQEHHAVTEPRAKVRTILEKSLGEEGAAPLLAGPDRGGGTPLALLESLEPEQFFTLLGEEHPQTIAIVLSHLSPAKAGRVLSQLSQDVASDVVTRMVHCDQGTPPAVLESILGVLGQRAQAMSSTAEPWASPERRLQLVADILAASSRAARTAALSAVRERDAELGDEVRERMFLFEDLPKLDPAGLRQVVTTLDTQTVALALKTASEEVKACIFGAVSRRAAQTIREEQELLGPRPLAEVEAAQQAIVEAVHRLVEQGQATIRRPGSDSDEEVA